MSDADSRTNAKKFSGLSLGRETGFSMVELLLAMAASSVILVAIYGVFTFTNKNFITQNAAASTQQTLRSAIGLMVKDIRVAGLDPTNSGNFGFELAEGNKIRFTLDSIDIGTGDFNGTVDETNFERVTYEFQGNQILQTLYEGTASQNQETLIDNIINLDFTYFDANNTDLGDPVAANQLEDIRTVEILITVQEPAGRSEPVSRTLTRRVECRNMAFD